MRDLLALIPLAPAWFRRRERERDCFHHDHRAGESWIVSNLIDLGRRKRFDCTRCGRVWIV